MYKHIQSEGHTHIHGDLNCHDEIGTDAIRKVIDILFYLILPSDDDDKTNNIAPSSALTFPKFVQAKDFKCHDYFKSSVQCDLLNHPS